MSKISQEDKNLKNILQGREVEKKIQVGGYDKEFSEKMKKEREEEKKAAESYSKMMASIRMPMFCPKCSGLMTKRLDKKFWMKGYKSCFSCVQKEEHKIRLKGPDAWREYEQKKVRENALSWLRDQEQEFKAWKEYLLKENKKIVNNMEKEFKNMKKEVLKRFK